MQSGSAQSAVDGDLWLLVRAAIIETRAVARKYMREGKYVPKANLPSVGQFNSGWPNLLKGGYLGSGPPQLSGIFGLTAQTLRPVAYDDVAALKQLMDYVLTRPDLEARLKPQQWEGMNTDQDAGRQEVFRSSTAQIALEVLDRAEALGLGEDTGARLEAIYREMEVWLLSSQLDVQLIVPLLLIRFEAEQLEIAPGVRIEKLDEKTQAARAPAFYGVDAVPEPLISAATHAIVVDGLTIENRSKWEPRDYVTLSSLPLDRIDMALQALRVLTSVSTGYAQVLLRAIGWADTWTHDLPVIKAVGTVRRYPSSFDNFGWLKPGDSIGNADLSLLPSMFSGLESGNARVRLAARRLAQAGVRDQPEDTTVDACIGIEALLLGTNETELIHRICLRAAAALALLHSDTLNGVAIYEATKKVYKHRSKIVHGAGQKKFQQIEIGGTKLPTHRVAVWLLRQLLQAIVNSSQPCAPEDLDMLILKSLNNRVGEPTSEDDTEGSAPNVASGESGSR
jgi:Apea-like HEPN